MECEVQAGILVASCSELSPSSIVKMILEKEELPISQSLLHGVETYPWHIDTKYYETDVSLYTLPNKMLLPEQFASGIHAVILAFDSTKDNGLEEVESWQSFLRDYDVDISILLCDRCTDSPSIGTSKLKAQEWCVAHGYELVELNPELDEEWEAEQDFIETTGIKRVVQALHAYVWPNLCLKARKEPTSMLSLLNGGGDDTAIEDRVEQLNIETLPHDLDMGNIEERLDELLGCGSETDFFQLFGELQTMKERVSALPGDQRKACAEQVVLAFWRAIGGNSDEIQESEPAPQPS